mmetsp:Transcript_26826/g.82606  ORF Transcript_26826/g.82606 Transcript_26826/m.82606 type:complete len:217 (-) Transcript_26826:162-812(-)
MVDEDELLAVCARVVLPGRPPGRQGDLPLENAGARGLEEVLQALRVHALPGAEERRRQAAGAGLRLRLRLGLGGLGLALGVALARARAGLLQLHGAGLLELAAGGPGDHVVELQAQGGHPLYAIGLLLDHWCVLHRQRDPHDAGGLTLLGQGELPLLQLAHLHVAGHRHATAEHMLVVVVLVPDADCDGAWNAVLRRPRELRLPRRVLVCPGVRLR